MTETWRENQNSVPGAHERTLDFSGQTAYFNKISCSLQVYFGIISGIFTME